MKKVKNLFLFIASSAFIVNMESVQAAKGTTELNHTEYHACEAPKLNLIASKESTSSFAPGFDVPKVPMTPFKPFHADNVHENEIYLKIVNEGQMLEGYTLKFQVYEDATHIITRTIDISDIPASSIRNFTLPVDLKKLLNLEDHSTRKTQISLWDNQGKKVAVYEYDLNLENINKSPFLEIILNANEASLDMNSLQDIGALAMLSAPQL
jgi:hypothetical protein